MRQDAVSTSSPQHGTASAFVNNLPCYSSPRALRQYTARRNPLGAAVGIEAAVGPACPAGLGVMTRTAKTNNDSADELD